MYEHDPMIVVAVVAQLLRKNSRDLCLSSLIVRGRLRSQGHDPVPREDLSSCVTLSLTLTLPLILTLALSSNWTDLKGRGNIPSPGNS